MNLGNMPAYPVTNYTQNMFEGMTLRQRYAMAAMQGLLGNSQLMASETDIANQSFLLADAMLAYEEREHEAKRQKGKQTYTEESEAETKENIREFLRDQAT